MFKFFFSKSRTKDTKANAFAIAIAVLSVLTVYSCSTPRMATVVRETTRDTLYLNHIQYDSIFVENQTFRDYRPSLQGGDGGRPDTVYLEKVRLEYKYKLLRDTVRVVQIDSIPVIREVEVIKTEKYVPSIYKWSLAICIILFCVFCAFCVIKIIVKR